MQPLLSWLPQGSLWIRDASSLLFQENQNNSRVSMMVPCATYPLQRCHSVQRMWRLSDADIYACMHTDREKKKKGKKK